MSNGQGADQPHRQISGIINQRVGVHTAVIGRLQPRATAHTGKPLQVYIYNQMSYTCTQFTAVICLPTQQPQQRHLVNIEQLSLPLSLSLSLTSVALICQVSLVHNDVHYIGDFILRLNKFKL